MILNERAKTLHESVIMKGLALAESSQWRDHTSAIREGYRKSHKKTIPNELLATTAQLLENTRVYLTRMDETTRVVNTGNFVDYGFDLISAIVPNLIATDIVSVQAMEQRVGAIFYLDYLYGNDKGSIRMGSVMNSPFTGVDGEFNYSNDKVNGEVVGTGDGTTTSFSTTLAYTPIRTGTAKVLLDGQVVAAVASNSSGVDTLAAVNSSGITGTVDLNTGAVAITATTAPAQGKLLVVDYRYNMDLTSVGFSQVDLDLKSISLEAFPRKLRARWLLDAAYDLKQMKGVDAENELVVAMGSEIKHEIDGDLCSELYRQAGNTGFTWNAQNPSTSLSYNEYKKTIIDKFTEMSNQIFVSTKRVGANFIVAGVNVCNIIETLEDFKAEPLGTRNINGPHLVGTLSGKWKVYKNPFYSPDVFLMGYKGDSWLDAGYVYAPYMPLYTTPTVVMDDFQFRKGLATSYGQVMINNMLYAKGNITNYSATRMEPATPIITQQTT